MVTSLTGHLHNASSYEIPRTENESWESKGSDSFTQHVNNKTHSLLIKKCNLVTNIQCEV